MKVLGIVGSPRKGGNTEILVMEALQAAREAGAETEIFLAAGKDIALCNACGACRVDENGVCVIQDDMQELYRLMESSDGIIFGTPVYFYNVSSQAKVIMDRTYSLRRGGDGKLKGKVAAALVVARRVGAGQVLSLIYAYFTLQGLIVAGGGIGYGRGKGEVRQGVGGSPSLSAMEEARSVGKSVVSLLKRLS